MKNPFEDIKIKPEENLIELGNDDEQKKAKRDAIYKKYDPMVNEILDMFIAAQRQGLWEKGSDCSRRHCCHVSWFAGPKEKYSDPYDIHHVIRRRIEITLELDGLCNPTSFKVANYAAIDKIVHVGLDTDELVRGIQVVMD